MPNAYFLFRKYFKYHYLYFRFLSRRMFTYCKKQVRYIIVFTLRTLPLEFIVKNVLNRWFFQSKTTNFIESVLGNIFMLFLIEKNSYLNIVRTERPNVKILNIAKLINKKWTFANLDFFGFVIRIDHFTSALYDRLVLCKNVVFLRPIFSQISRIRPSIFPFHNNFPRDHKVIDNVTFELQFFHWIESEIIWIVCFLTWVFRPDIQNTNIFGVVNFFKFMITNLSLVFWFDANILFSNDVFWDFKGKKNLFDQSGQFLRTDILKSDKVIKNADIFLLHNVHSFLLNRYS